MLRDDALKIANDLIELLNPVCEKIEIAGSIRRLKEDVKDIELLAIPDLTKPPLAKIEFGKPIPKGYSTYLDMLIQELRDSGNIILQKSGNRYKKFLLNEHNISVDLFLVLPPATWGVQALIRTGPADFSHWCVTRHKHGGALPNGYRVQDGAVWRGEKEIKNPEIETQIGFESEFDFFDFLNLEYVEPCDRVANWKKVK